MAAKDKKGAKTKKVAVKSPKIRSAAKSTKLAGAKSVLKNNAVEVAPTKTVEPKELKTPSQTVPSSNEDMQEQRLTKTYLTPEELKHFEEILLQKRAEVLRDLEIMRNAYSEDNNHEESNSSYSMHMADHGTETMDKEQHFMFIARDERYLSYIDKALERIKNGTYGICAVSGLPIPKERLEAVPHTAVRIEYKNRSK